MKCRIWVAPDNFSYGSIEAEGDSVAEALSKLEDALSKREENLTTQLRGIASIHNDVLDLKGV